MAANIRRIFLISVAPPKIMLKESIFFPISPNACITQKKVGSSAKNEEIFMPFTTQFNLFPIFCRK